MADEMRLYLIFVKMAVLYFLYILPFCNKKEVIACQTAQNDRP
jgi:hypothetical protein